MQTRLNVKLLAHTPDMEKIIATSAKLCYSSVGVDELEEKLTSQEVNRFLDMLMEMGHESPVEHATFTFAIEGVSRALTHQLVRHRLASYSQQSQRYVNASQFCYIVPPAIDACDEAKQLFVNHMEQCQDTYDELVYTLLTDKCSAYVPHDIDKCDSVDYLMEHKKQLYKKLEKECFEEARYCLPNAAETKIIMTMNVRSLLNFLKHRCCDRAQSEIMSLADAILIECKKVAPSIFKYAGPSCVHGKCTEGKMCCGKQLEKKRKYA